jgi:hypothetical protein
MIMRMRFYLGLVCALFVSYASAADLRGNVALNITSDTATTAKNMAMDEARRQIISDVLGQYSDRVALENVLATTKNSALNTLIESTAIDGEQTSATTYSANITMVIDASAARAWLTENGIQNWMPDDENANRFVVWAEMSEPIVNWTEINRISRDEKIDVQLKSVQGNQIVFDVPVSVRGAFTIAVREAGWQYSDKDGILRVWK